MHLFATELIANQSTCTNLAKKYTIHIFCEKCTVHIFLQKMHHTNFLRKMNQTNFLWKMNHTNFSVKNALYKFSVKNAPYKFSAKIVQVSRCHIIPCEPWFPMITCCLSMWQYFAALRAEFLQNLHHHLIDLSRRLEQDPSDDVADYMLYCLQQVASHLSRI